MASAGRMSSLRGGLATLAALLGAACSMTTSLDGLTGGTAFGPNGPMGGDGPLFDGGKADSGGTVEPGIDSGPDDDVASSDSATPDVITPPPPVDSGSDAASSFCATHGFHLVCDDFDEVPPQTWKVRAANGTQGIDALSSTSPPNAYWATTATLGSPLVAQLEWSRHFPTAPQRYHLEYSLRVDARDTTREAALAAIEISDPATGMDYTLGLTLIENGAEAEESYSATGGPSVFVNYVFPKDVPNGTWVRITTDVTFGSGGAHLTMTMDGAIVVANQALQVTTVSGQTDLFLGVAYLQGPSSPWKVRYDDVIFDMQ